jgi:hypothetical protein
MTPQASVALMLHSPDIEGKPIWRDDTNEHDLRAKVFEDRETPGDWRVD